MGHFRLGENRDTHYRRGCPPWCFALAARPFGLPLAEEQLNSMVTYCKEAAERHHKALNRYGEHIPKGREMLPTKGIFSPRRKSWSGCFSLVHFPS
jgi:hypothetical protein